MAASRYRTARSRSPRSDHENSSDKASSLVEKLLEGGLLKTLEVMVERQFTKHKGSMQHGGQSENDTRAGSSEDHSGEFGGNRRIRVRAESDLFYRSQIREVSDYFDPEDRNANIDRWLADIDKLGSIHGWSNYEYEYFLQAHLKGAAREWYLRLDNSFDWSWAKWKAALSHAFSPHQDYAVMLEEMLFRVKQPDESMANYFHEKMTMCSRCEIGGDKAVSLLIHGLPEALRAGAHTVKCKTPQELFSKYMAEFDEYKAGPSSDNGKRQGATSGDDYTARTKFPRTRSPEERSVSRRGGSKQEVWPKARCFNCQEYTNHLSRDCPKPRMDRCSRCKRAGHMATECPKLQKASTSRRTTHL